MIGKLLALLTGSAGPWIVLGIAVTCLAAGGASGYTARGIIDAPALANEKTATAQADARTAQCVATHEKGRADGAEKTVGALNAAAGNVADALNGLAQKGAARAKADSDFMKELANAPQSKTCGGSAAELAYRRSVQPHTPAVSAAP